VVVALSSVMKYDAEAPGACSFSAALRNVDQEVPVSAPALIHVQILVSRVMEKP